MQHVRLEHLAKQDLVQIMPIAFLTLAAQESLIVVCHNLHGNTLCAQKGNVCEQVCANDIYLETMFMAWMNYVQTYSWQRTNSSRLYVIA